MAEEPEQPIDPKQADRQDVGYGTWALVQQSLFLLIGAIMLDGGHMLHCAAASLPPYWVGYLVIMFRRADRLTLLDELFLRFAPLVLFLGFALIVPWLFGR